MTALRALPTLAATALILALVACGQEEEPPPVGVGELLRRSPVSELVAVRGRAVPVDDEWFVVGDDGASIYVHAPREDAAPLRLQEVIVVGQLERFESGQAIELADRVAETNPAAGPGAVIVVRARRKQGDPYIELRAIRAAS